MKFSIIVCLFLQQKILRLRETEVVSQLAVNPRFKRGLFYLRIHSLSRYLPLVLKLNVRNTIAALVRKGRRRYKPHCQRFLCFGRKSPRVRRKQTPAWLQVTLKGDYNVIKDTMNRVKGRITLNKKDCWIKNGQELNRHFPKMTNQLVNEHVKRCSTSLVLRAKQIGTTIEITA